MTTLAERMEREADLRGRREMVLVLFDAKFGGLSEPDRARVEAGSKEDYRRWSRRLLSADSLEQVFASDPLD